MKNHNLFLIFLLFSAFTLLINVGTYGVAETSDARYAEISREMLQNGDYVHPDLLDIHHYHKPPFTYQITALGLHLFGVNAFGARFFLQIAVILQLILVYALSLALFDTKKTALWSAVIYFSFPILLIASRNLTTDAFLTTFALAAIFFWVKYRKSGKYLFLYLFTLSLALGFLTKGPVIFIVPLIFIIFYNRFEPLKNNWSVHHFLSWVLFLIVAGWWYFYLIYENPEFVNYFLGRQTVDRFSKNAFDRTEPFWYFLVLSPLIGLPWVTAFFQNFKPRKKWFTHRTIYSVLALSFIIPLVFFSISSSKRILYVLPLYSVLAVLVSEWIHTFNPVQARRMFNVVLTFALIVFLAIIGGVFLKTDFQIPKWVAFLAVFSIILSALIYRLSKDYQTKSILISALTTGFLLISGSGIMSQNELQINSSKPVTDFLKAQKLDSKTVVVYNSMQPSVAFGLNKSIISLYDGHKNLIRESQFETDTNWQNHWFDLQKANPDDLSRLQVILQKPYVVISYKKPIPENQNWLISNLLNQTKIGKYHLYY